MAQAYLEEKGASILFLAVGLATWDVVTGARPNAPVILLPLSVEPEDAAHRGFVLQAAGDAHFNPIMVHALRTEYGVELDDTAFDLEDPPDSFADVVALLGQVASSLPQVDGIAITPRLVVGNFRYNNLPLVADLEQNLEPFAANDLVAAIAGVPAAREALGGVWTIPHRTCRTLNRRPASTWSWMLTPASTKQSTGLLPVSRK